MVVVEPVHVELSQFCDGGTQVDGHVKLHFLMLHISYGEVPIVVHIPHKARQWLHLEWHPAVC